MAGFSKQTHWQRRLVQRLRVQIQYSSPLDCYWSAQRGACLFRSINPNRKTMTLPDDAVHVGRYLRGIAGNVFLEDLAAAGAVDPNIEDGVST